MKHDTIKRYWTVRELATVLHITPHNAIIWAHKAGAPQMGKRNTLRMNYNTFKKAVRLFVKRKHRTNITWQQPRQITGLGY